MLKKATMLLNLIRNEAMMMQSVVNINQLFNSLKREVSLIAKKDLKMTSLGRMDQRSENFETEKNKIIADVKKLQDETSSSLSKSLRNQMSR